MADTGILELPEITSLTKTLEPVSGVGKLQAVQAFNARLLYMPIDETTYYEVVNGVRLIMGYDGCALFLYNPNTSCLELKGASGYSDIDDELKISINDETSIHAEAFQEEYQISLPNLLENPEVITLSKDLSSNLVIPVISNKGPVGVFDFGSFSAHTFTPDEISMCSMLVDQMAYSLENIRLVGELSDSRDAVIRGMALLAELRDGHIGGHISRICAMSEFLAEMVQGEKGFREVNPSFISALKRAAALHDVGKVGIPDAILLKPAKLTEEEFLVMKSHTSIGADTLDGLIAEFGRQSVLTMGAAVARSHHERWDGKGYPEGLAGEDIPLAARIVSICDVYDALCSRRVYKEAWAIEDTLQLISDGRGTQFDPRLTDIVLKNAKSINAIRARFPEG